MRRLMRLFLLAGSLLTLSARAVPSESADEDAIARHIAALDAKWTQAINDGDGETVASLFAPNGRILPPGAPEVQGRAAVESYANGLAALPNLDFRTTPDVIQPAEAGDYAYLTGTFTLRYGEEGSWVEDSGKYVVIWQKIDGQWLVIVDTFNSDTPN